MGFYEIYKMLISTETSYKDDSAPHAFVTGIDACTQKQVASVEFDYQKVYDREDTYQDVVGFFHTHPSGMNNMSSIDVETMNQWVKCLGKDLVCVIQTDKTISGWLFVKGDGGVITYRNIYVSTDNDVNYDIWFDASSSDSDFWKFLDNSEFHSDELEEENVISEILNSLNEMKKNQEDLFEGFVTLTEVMQLIMKSIMKEDEDE